MLHEFNLIMCHWIVYMLNLEVILPRATCSSPVDSGVMSLLLLKYD